MMFAVYNSYSIWNIILKKTDASFILPCLEKLRSEMIVYYKEEQKRQNKDECWTQIFLLWIWWEGNLQIPTKVSIFSQYALGDFCNYLQNYLKTGMSNSWFYTIFLWTSFVSDIINKWSSESCPEDLQRE